MDRKWVIPIASAVPILAIAYAFSLGPSPHKVLLDFQTVQLPDARLIEPLLEVDPDEMAPLVITEIADRKMVRRRQAIAYLGKIESRLALPALERILADESEAAGVRADALGAIGAIDRARARQHAVTYREAPTELGRLAREMLAKKSDVVSSRLR